MIAKALGGFQRQVEEKSTIIRHGKPVVNIIQLRQVLNSYKMAITSEQFEAIDDALSHPNLGGRLESLSIDGGHADPSDVLPSFEDLLGCTTLWHTIMVSDHSLLCSSCGPNDDYLNLVGS